MISSKLDKIITSCSQNEQRWLIRSHDIASEQLSGLSRGNGLPFMDHVVAVAEIVAFEIGLSPEAIAAVFMHEASRSNNELLESCKKEFSDEIIAMARSLNKISEIKPKDTGLLSDNYRKLIVSYSHDPRVSLIKLADRLEVMRNLDFFAKSKQIKKATETLLLYAPLAHQLGLYNLKSEMEDLSFKYTDPEQYRLITNKLKAGEQDRKRLMDIFVRPIEMSLRKAHIPYRLKSRTKTAYSIWKKMQAKQIPFEEVADIFAIRIIIDVPDASSEKEKELCWKVYSFVTEHYEPDTSRLRDWITVPKSNGYESLHTTVTAQNNQRIEVQIRTSRMDDVAENGYASHWLYKGVKNDASLNAWLTSVKNLLESPYKKPEAQFNLFSNDVFVFTPEGDLRKLPADSSVLDFAFDIHTNLGLKCSGAKINGKLCSIREKLKTGDVVEVITSKNQRPSSDWLNFVVSSKAKAKIRQKLNEELGKQIQAGKELFERRMSNWKIDVNDEVLNFLVKQCKFKSIGEFYSALAVGTLDIMDVKDILSSREEREESGVGEESSFQTQKNIQKSYDGSDILMIDDKLNNVGYKLAKCCNPIMGDEVFGFVTVKDGIKIHRIGCPNAARLISNYPYRVQKVKWKESSEGSNFQTSIKVSSYLDFGLSQQIMEIVNNLSISMRFFSISENKGMIEAKMQVAVPNNQVLDKLLFNLRKIKGVKSVTRITNV
ncbi:MAG: RelA/SpoT family protein [Rikenellaceae bacterium]|jgi:GTP pyrophosphokinase|nr:bifunctional (p)ppGpp synthetase/guanosine-3',5'-bis(diphosphate) 3'-pyrophosphohydrolase [Bacteroidales bacterium]